FHLHPHYRAPLLVETTLRKLEPGSDEFPGEKDASEIEQILARWSADLRKPSPSLVAVEQSLGQNFSGSSFSGLRSQKLRSGSIETWKNTFPQERVGRDGFVRDLRAAFAAFSRIHTAEFEITAIQGALPRVRTRVRYDLAGSGKDFFREQRTGYWELEWVGEPSAGLRLEAFQALDETRSRTLSPIFADIASTAFGNNSSYGDQLLHGSDYWRTVIDGASGIDVYGHNGISVGDMDNDGFDEVYVSQPAGLPNRLYRNRGDGTFEDVTEGSGVGILDNTACALFVDIDNDGRQDLVVVSTSGPLLFLNQGNGGFRRIPDAFRFLSAPEGYFTGAAAADYDRDGWLDIYFCVYSYYQGAGQYRYPLPYYDANNGPPNFMMRNNRDGTFRDVTEETGLNQNNTRYSFCCAWSDSNGNGWPDLYVVNDFGRKNLYRNNGNGTFNDIAQAMGVEDVGAGMSVSWFDYDNDGVEDLYVGNMWSAPGERISTQDVFRRESPEPVRKLYQKHAMGNSLLHLRENRFEDVTRSAGAGMGRWAWSADAWDFDHDGFLDLYIANGMVSGPLKTDLNGFFWRQTVASSPDAAEPARRYEQGWNAINELIRADGTWSGYERNVFYANNGDGTFSDVSAAAGLDFVEDARSFALADFDHDGRLEVFLKNRNAPQVRLLKNIVERLPASISFRLRGTKSNRDAIGAILTLTADGQKQTRSLRAGSGFLSQHSKEIFFGLGNRKQPVWASIQWPSGLVQRFENLPLDHTVWLEEGATDFRAEPFRAPRRAGKRANDNGKDRLAGARQNRTPSEEIPSAAGTWLLSPVRAPDFSLSDPSGRAHSLAALRGKAVLASFWTAESPLYRDTLGALERLRRSASDGIELVAINADDPPNARARQTDVRDLHLSFPVLLASEDVSAIYNILYRFLFDRHRDLTLPTSFLIDSGGNIVKVYQGVLDVDRVIHDVRHIPRTDSERLAVALPFAGITDSAEFTRNYFSLGSIYFEQGYHEEASRAFEEAARQNPQSAEALYALGSIYLEAGKNVEARENFERATRLQPASIDTLPNAWNNLGLLAAREGQAGNAIPYFEKALKLDPDHVVALKNLGNAYRQEKRWDEARATFEHAIRVAPEDAEANYGLGMVFAQLNDADRANQYLERALKFRPGYPEALNNLAILYLRSGRRDQAVRNLEECIRSAPAFDQSYLNLARVYVLEKFPDKARGVLRELLKQHPDHPTAKAMLRELGGD
ncbi:MAG: VCBS repeat-containing protein, partial [Acidobacteria bacterium]|nr:VCBS repeat-containing protein [Acidobacteriota bacterium]